MRNRSWRRNNAVNKIPDTVSPFIRNSSRRNGSSMDGVHGCGLAPNLTRQFQVLSGLDGRGS